MSDVPAASVSDGSTHSLASSGPDNARTIMRRVGWVLLIVGLLDIAWLVYCIFASRSYQSPFNIVAVVTGLFLLRGSLRAAAIVAWGVTFYLTILLWLLAVLSLRQPLSLLRAELRLETGHWLMVGILIFGLCAILAWISRELRRAPVLTARRETGAKVRSIWWAIVPATLFCVPILAFGVTLLNGAAAVHARQLARTQVGPEFEIWVRFIRVDQAAAGTVYTAMARAWNEASIRDVTVQWRR